MKPRLIVILAGVLVFLAAAAGYWLGKGSSTNTTLSSNAPSTQERQPLYYRNPMGLADISSVPKKDNMGMDYVPVYADDLHNEEGGVKINLDKMQKLGVRTEKVKRGRMTHVVRASGRILADERRIIDIAPKFEGYVEKLYVNVTGQQVKKGQTLFEVYSPELISAQNEYVIAARGARALHSASADAKQDMTSIAEASLDRLRNWDIADSELKLLKDSGEARRTLPIASPAAGVVVEKKVVQGTRFSPGETLFRVADLSQVWLIAEIFEQDIGKIKVGGMARVQLTAFPGQTFSGRIAYVYPSLTSETRTVPVRVELANPGFILKPEMYAQVEIDATAKASVLMVPTSAVIDSGREARVFVKSGEGRFFPRTVKLGQRGADKVEILSGLTEDEEVVTSANFLIDAESNLQAAAGALQSSSTSTSYQAVGTVEKIDAKPNTLAIHHEPIAALNWPQQTHTFTLPSLPSSASTLEFSLGQRVKFQFTEEKPGMWLISHIEPIDAATNAK